MRATWICCPFNCFRMDYIVHLKVKWLHSPFKSLWRDKRVPLSASKIVVHIKTFEWTICNSHCFPCFLFFPLVSPFVLHCVPWLFGTFYCTLKYFKESGSGSGRGGSPSPSRRGVRGGRSPSRRMENLGKSVKVSFVVHCLSYKNI